MEIIIRCLCSTAVNIPYADTLSTVVASLRPEGHSNKTTICGMSEFYYTIGQYIYSCPPHMISVCVSVRVSVLLSIHSTSKMICHQKSVTFKNILLHNVYFYFFFFCVCASRVTTAVVVVNSLGAFICLSTPFRSQVQLRDEP